MTNAAADLKAAMAKLDLRVNGVKSLVAGQDVAEARNVATDLGFTYVEDGMRILGAWVSVHSRTEKVTEGTVAFLKDRLKEYELFFTRVKLMRADQRMSVLRACGPARWVFLVRTHHPKHAGDMHRRFDDMLREAFADLAGVPPERLTEQGTALSLHLPLRDGGMGLTNMERIKEDAYIASREEAEHRAKQARTGKETPQPANQDARVSASNRTAVLRLSNRDQAWSEHLTACSKNSAYFWLLCNDNASNTLWFTREIANRMRLPLGPTDLFRCPGCKRTYAPANAVRHAKGCPLWAGPNSTTRHHAAVNALAVEAANSGFEAHKEVVIHEDGRRIDLVINGLSGKTWYIDVSFVSDGHMANNNDYHLNRSADVLPDVSSSGPDSESESESESDESLGLGLDQEEAGAQAPNLDAVMPGTNGDAEIGGVAQDADADEGEEDTLAEAIATAAFGKSVEHAPGRDVDGDKPAKGDARTAMTARCAEKEKKYGAIAKEHGAELLTCLFTINGGMGTGTRKLLTAMADTTAVESPNTVMQRVLRKVMVANGAISQKLHMYTMRGTVMRCRQHANTNNNLRRGQQPRGNNRARNGASGPST